MLRIENKLGVVLKVYTYISLNPACYTEIVMKIIKRVNYMDSPCGLPLFHPWSLSLVYYIRGPKCFLNCNADGPYHGWRFVSSVKSRYV